MVALSLDGRMSKSRPWSQNAARSFFSKKAATAEAKVMFWQGFRDVPGTFQWTTLYTLETSGCVSPHLVFARMPSGFMGWCGQEPAKVAPTSAEEPTLDLQKLPLGVEVKPGAGVCALRTTMLMHFLMLYALCQIFAQRK